MRYKNFQIEFTYQKDRYKYTIKVVEWSPTHQIYEVQAGNGSLKLHRYPVDRLEGPDVFYPHWMSTNTKAPALFKQAVAIEIDRWLLCHSVKPV